MPHHGAFRRVEELNPAHIDAFYLAAVEAAVEAVEEAVVNAIVAGEDVAMVKPEGRMCPAIDTAALAALFAERDAAVRDG